MKIPDVIPVIPAGEYPKELVAACASLGAEPGELLDWAVKKEEVVLVLATGQKGRVVVSRQLSVISEEKEVEGLTAGRRGTGRKK